MTGITLPEVTVGTMAYIDLNIVWQDIFCIDREQVIKIDTLMYLSLVLLHVLFFFHCHHLIQVYRVELCFFLLSWHYRHRWHSRCELFKMIFHGKHTLFFYFYMRIFLRMRGSFIRCFMGSLMKRFGRINTRIECSRVCSHF